MYVLSPNPWQLIIMFVKCLTWFEYQPEMNQYNTCTLRELHDLVFRKRGESLKQALLELLQKEMYCMQEQMHVYLYNVVLVCISLIQTTYLNKRFVAFDQGVWITEDSLYLSAIQACKHLPKLMVLAHLFNSSIKPCLRALGPSRIVAAQTSLSQMPSPG